MNNIGVYWRKVNRWCKALIPLALVQFEIIPQRRSGFYCKDSSLSHPYTGDTISWKLLLFIAIILPFLVLWLTEIIIHKFEKTEIEDTVPKRKSIRKWYKEYIYGLLVNVTLVQILKVIVGEPRPHFFDTCKPSEALSCKEYEYVSSYTCTSNWQPSWLAESSRSFPSGHTSIGVYAALFTAWYLQRRTKGVVALKRPLWFVQLTLLSAAALCSLSRIYDRRHHWWDVLAGFAFGLFMLVYSVVFLCDGFSCEPTHRTLAQKSNSTQESKNSQISNGNSLEKNQASDIVNT